MAGLGASRRDGVLRTVARRLAKSKPAARRAAYRVAVFTVLFSAAFIAAQLGFLTPGENARALRGDGGRRTSECPPAGSGSGGDEPAVVVELNGCMTDGANYPPEIFTCEQLGNGAIVLHIIGVLYMFVALSIVCDEYFVPSLDVITEKTGVSDDVAGATFMAAGGSAPELFTSFIGVFLAESNVGFGTIVGSAVFNILFVIGMCAVFSTGDLELTWYPLARDCFFYSVSLLVLVICFADGEIEWYEALIMFSLYVMYVTAMMNNAKLHAFVLKVLHKKRDVGPHGRPIDVATGIERQTSNLFKNPLTFRAGALALMLHNVDALGRGPDVGKEKRFQRAGMLIVSNLRDRGDAKAGDVVRTPYGIAKVLKYRLASTAPYVVELTQWTLATKRGPTAYLQATDVTKIGVGASHEAVRKKAGGGLMAIAEAAKEAEDGQPAAGAAAVAAAADSHVVDARTTGAVATEDVKAEVDGDDLETSALEWPILRPGESSKSLAYRRTMFLILAPLAFTLAYTVPNTQFTRNRKYFIIAFIMSIVWIAVYSFLMVWWATQIGDTWGIPPEVMGLTFLAAGTSVPDLLTSVIVAKQGLADMAVSSSVGSNIFDVTVGLPVPWMVWSFANELKPISVASDGLFTSVVVLFLMLVVVVCAIAASGWVMSTRLGISMFVLYALFVAHNLLTEYGHLPTIGGSSCN